MAISISQVEYVAKLAKLKLTEEEKIDYAKNLSAVLDYMEHLKEIDTRNVVATTHVLPLQNVFREDVVKPGLPIKEALANAPDQQDGYFKVPRIL